MQEKMMNKILYSVIASAVLFSGCSFKPTLPQKNTEFMADYGEIRIDKAWCICEELRV